MKKWDNYILLVIAWCLLFHFLGFITYDTAWLTIAIVTCTKSIVDQLKGEKENAHTERNSRVSS